MDDGDQWVCKVCDDNEPLEAGDMLNHFRLIHPDVFENSISKMETWPDGTPIAHEEEFDDLGDLGFA